MRNRSRDESQSDGQCLRKALTIEWWQTLEAGGDFGAANWESLVSIRDRVTAALALSPPDLDEADSLTGFALMLVNDRTIH